MKILPHCCTVQHEFHAMSRTEQEALWWETPVSVWTMINWKCNLGKQKLHSALYHLIMLTLPYLTNHRLLKEYIPFCTHCISIFHWHLTYYKWQRTVQTYCDQYNSHHEHWNLFATQNAYLLSRLYEISVTKIKNNPKKPKKHGS
jgi:hypothetical protein